MHEACRLEAAAQRQQSGVVRGLLESALQGWLGRGSLRAGHQVGVDWAFWEAVCGVFQEGAAITGFIFPRVSLSDDE